MTIRSFASTRSWTFLMPLFLLAQAVIRDSYGWLVFTLPGVCVFLLVPQRGARQVVPFLALAIGAVDFLGVRTFLDHRFAAPYSKVTVIGRVPWQGSLLMPTAAAFLAVGVWLYFRLDVPGAAWLAGSVARYRERAGAFFWPAMAFIPVQVLGWELFSGLGKPGPVPAVTAVLVMIAVGVYGMFAYASPGPGSWRRGSCR